MARDIKSFSVTVPAGTGSLGTFAIFPINFEPRRVTGIEIMFPYGSRGAVGLAVGNSTTPLIPSNAGGYLTGDDTTLKYDLSGYVDSGNWTLFAWNIGSWPHTVQIRFICELVSEAPPARLTPLSSAVLRV